MKKQEILPCDKCGKDARDNEYLFRICSCCVKEVRKFIKELNKNLSSSQ